MQVVEYFTTDRPGPPAHSHPWHEVEVVLDGAVEFLVEGTWTAAPAGTVLLLPAGAPHSVRVRAAGPACSWSRSGRPTTRSPATWRGAWTSVPVRRARCRRGPARRQARVPARMAPLDLWAISAGEVWVNERDAAALVRIRVRGERRGQRIDMAGNHLVRFDAAGRIVEGWGFADDQAALDRFFAA